jgi:hypothetical protein
VDVGWREGGRGLGGLSRGGLRLGRHAYQAAAAGKMIIIMALIYSHSTLRSLALCYNNCFDQWPVRTTLQKYPAACSSMLDLSMRT